MASRTRVRGIDEELWFGTYSDADAEKKAAESVAATVGRVVGAKPFPVAAQRLADATRDPDCSLVQVVRILERDMALSARVLRLVNSASFALRTPCTSVRHAASLVGTQKLNQLATTAAILDMVDHTSVHASRILEHSAVVGGICRYLGVHLGLPADELFTCGFLHDIGKLMLLEVEGKRYGELLTEVGDEYDAIHLYERDLFGFDHALLAGHVLSRWSIPDPVPKVVAWHHHVTRAYEEGPRWASMTSVLRLADLLSYSLASDNDEAEVERAARSESASYLDISAAQLAAIWDELRNLHERSRALFRGEEPPRELPEVSLRPAARIGRPSASKGLRHSHPSLRPPTLRGLAGLSGVPSSGGAGRSLQVAAPTKVQIKEVPEGPKQFPCVVCKGPSFANVCLACHGYVCPDHQRGPEQWCELCRNEFATESYGVRLRPILILMLGAGIGATIVGALASAAGGRGFGSTAVLVGPLLGTGLAAGLVAIFHRYAHRAWFLRTRIDRSVAGPAHISTPLPPGTANEKVGAGVQELTRPAEPVGLESIFAQAASDDVRIRSEAPPPSRGRALATASTVGDAGPSFSARVFASGAPAAGDARESLPVRGVSNRASAAPEGQVASLVPSRSIAVGPASRAPAQTAAYPSGIPASLAPAPAAARAESLAPASLAPPAASLPPLEGASAFPPEESSREAAERGRTLRLLSEHSASNPPGSVRAVPSSAPQISVRPVVDADARTLHFPDWSEPPAPREGRVEAAPAEAEIAARVATTAESPAIETPNAASSRGEPVTAPARASAVRPEQAWKLVLQATGTADGW